MDLSRFVASGGDLGSLDYVAIVVDELESAVDLYRNTLFASVSPREEHERHGFSAAYVDLGYARLKLMQAYDRTRPVVGLVDAQARFGLHHVSYKVTEIASVRQRMIGRGYRPFGTDGVLPAPGGRMSFLRPPDSRLPLIRLFEAGQT
jgi:methylmalonyl-CoA/ethylmalonyl-CoA epimerase